MRARRAAAEAWRRRGEGGREGGSCIWAVAGREAVQHADSDAGWKLGRRGWDLNLDPRTQTHRCAHLLDHDSAEAPRYFRVDA